MSVSLSREYGRTELGRFGNGGRVHRLDLVSKV